jgi:hypothetical protein
VRLPIEKVGEEFGKTKWATVARGEREEKEDKDD